LIELISTANNDRPIQEFRQNQFFKLFIQEKNEQGQRRPSVSPSPNRGSNRGFKRGADAKAIFVGGIPSTVTEEQLRKVFLSYGNILDCKIIRKSLGGKFGIHQSTYVC
jgi:RNA recognition motif-containing protein